jgi:hypothetical protein
MCVVVYILLNMVVSQVLQPNSSSSSKYTQNPTQEAVIGKAIISIPATPESNLACVGLLIPFLALS